MSTCEKYDDDLWRGGYDDAIDDALRDIEGTSVLDESAKQSLMRLLAVNSGRYTECASCEGSGENRNPDKRDLLKAMIISVGAQTSSPLVCKNCGGRGYHEVQS
tara:strand:- start:22356 stop:22667 length:312 start_codon:yes stop_codon:yes gene_type:complete